MTASSINEGYDEFLAGLQIIEREIIRQVRDAGGQIDASNFHWHEGKELLPPPSAIALKISTPERTINATFSRGAVEDSWDRVDRGDVRARIRVLVEELTKG
jgi:hypothetical protein